MVPLRIPKVANDAPQAFRPGFLFWLPKLIRMYISSDYRHRSEPVLNAGEASRAGEGAEINRDGGEGIPRAGQKRESERGGEKDAPGCSARF